ncbi:MAG: HYR domain-containing protein [Bacteroidota bacterium]
MTYSYKQLCSLMVCLTLACSTFGETIYVRTNATGENDGESWADAYTTLSAALSEAESGDQIWVSAGTYYPTNGANRNIAFELPNAVQILGGFPASGNPALGGRNPIAHPTILSGDIDQDGTSANNSYTIIFTQNVSSTTVLDGFIVENGNANAPFSLEFPVFRNNGGAAWYNVATSFQDSEPTIRNCTFRNNFALNRGGAMFNRASTGGSTNYRLENCIFDNNTANQEGGAIYNSQGGATSQCNPTYTTTNFTNNFAKESGGAIYNEASYFGEISINFVGCNFVANEADSLEGGAIFNNAFFQGISNSIYTNCTFENNVANPGSGGAIYNDASGAGTCDFQMTNCRFLNNESGTYGGAISNIVSNDGSMNPVMANCTFVGNTSRNGGATYSRVAFGGEIDVVVANCVFYSNNANVGGAIYQNETGVGSVVNTKVSNTIFEASTAGFNPIFHLTGSPTVTVNNSILDASSCSAIVIEGENGLEATCTGGNIFNQSPQFIDAANGNFRVLNTSPAIDAGNNADVPASVTTDADGNPRIAGGTVDIGLYEQVNTSSDNDGDGIADVADNCPFIPNPTQADADSDGAGTACDCDDSIATGASCATGCSTFYFDNDEDGFGNPAVSVTTCVAPNGYVANNQDFNDNDDTLYPNAPELCDGKDNNNNGQTDEGTDDDGDGVCNEDDVCPGGDDTVDLNNNGTPDACESAITISCPTDITVSAAAGQSSATATWDAPTATTDCNGGGGNGGSCNGDPIAGFTYKGSFEGSDYYLSDGAAIWTTAQANAVANGAHLVVINSAAENAFVKSIAENNILHIGLTDATTEGTYEWVNGDNVGYTNLVGNPKSEDYGIFYFWDGTWDLDGNYTKKYLIEKSCGGGGNSGLQVQQTAGPSSGSAFPFGTTTVTYTATDGCGGSITCSFNVTVESTASNINLTCPSNIALTAAPGATGAVASWATPNPTSDCATGSVNLTVTQASGTTFPIGNTTVTYTATDGCGSTTTCSFIVTVSEGTSEINLLCPPNISIDAAAGANSAIITYQGPIANTTCQTAGTTVERIDGPASGAAFPIGVTTVEYRATDQCGSTTTCSFTVTVNSVGSELNIICPENLTATVSSATQQTVITWGDPIVTTNCAAGGATFTQTGGPSVGSLFDPGNYTITYSATDNCGNTTTCSFTITVTVSSSNLAITCPPTVNISVPQGSSGGVATWSNPTATTECTINGGGGGGTTCTGASKAGFTYLGNYNGSDYYLSDGQAPWLTAKANCETAGGTLVCIENQAENDYVKDIVGTEIIHIGLTDEAEEGTPVWLNGEPTTFLNTIETNNSDDKDYTNFYWWNGTWDWVSNSSWKKYMLEIKCGSGGGPMNSVPTITQIAGLSSGSTFPVGTTFISYQATDDCGNTATCGFNVVVTETAATCTPDNNGGQISGNEIICDPYDPQTITSSALPSGGSGAIEYVWLASTSGCPNDLGQAIANSNSPTYNPPFITATTYYVRWSRRANCNDWIPSNCITKTVDVCGGNTDYCDLSAEQPWQEWISRVQIADLDNTSGKSLGYDDYTNLVANVTGGQAYTVSVNLTFSYNQWDENVYVWIDFNQDNDFNDPGELVLETLSPSNGNGGPQPDASTATFTIPSNAVAGATRMRVAMKREASANPCDTAGDNYVHGEVEDYTVNISAASASRAKPVLAFDAYAWQGNPVLEWFTNTRDLEEHFEVERSVDNEQFEVIRDVEVVYLEDEKLDGFYKIKDESPHLGDNYYRIKQVFTDGTTVLTPTKHLIYGHLDQQLQLYPNPASTHLFVDAEDFVGRKGRIQVVNMLGQIQKDFVFDEITNPIIRLPLDNVQNGMYSLLFVVEGRALKTELFVVETSQ